MSASTAVKLPLVPPLTVMSLASKPVTPSENWKVKVTGPLAMPATLSLMSSRVEAATGLLADISAVKAPRAAKVAFLS